MAHQVDERLRAHRALPQCRRQVRLGLIVNVLTSELDGLALLAAESGSNMWVIRARQSTLRGTPRRTLRAHVKEAVGTNRKREARA
jgi:hypothetical protein